MSRLPTADCPIISAATIADRDRLLVQTPAMLYANLRIDVRTQTEAVAIDRERKEVTVRSVRERLPTGDALTTSLF